MVNETLRWQHAHDMSILCASTLDGGTFGKNKMHFKCVDLLQNWT